MRTKLHIFALAAVLSGCAFVPVQNPRLAEARTALDELNAIPESRRLAASECQQASDALARAVEAWQTLQDPALVDHLSYLAKQRAAIARAKIVAGYEPPK